MNMLAMGLDFQPSQKLTTTPCGDQSRRLPDFDQPLMTLPGIIMEVDGTATCL